MNCLADYGLCDQTVTLYRRRGDGVTRQVVDNACFSYTLQQVTDPRGTRQETMFTLIIPGDARLQPGDRVFDGIGPEDVDWDTFLPVSVPGLAQVEYAQLCNQPGLACHTRAGRR